MTPVEPYLIKAFYDWMLDNSLTPMLLVDAEQDGVDVPRWHVKEGRIALDISPGACRDINLGIESISFSASFQGEPRHITFPTSAVLAIYCTENGKGMFFSSGTASSGDDASSAAEIEQQEPAIADEQTTTKISLSEAEQREQERKKTAKQVVTKIGKAKSSKPNLTRVK